jgi:apolipoprotein N-acyltransferase
LITISNDSWFGNSIGPLQHLQIAQMRARENGRYVLRATNNGVSAIIDHQGRIVDRTEQFVEATLLGKAEVMLGNTPFGSFGTAPIITISGVTLLLMGIMYVGFWRDTE